MPAGYKNSDRLSNLKHFILIGGAAYIIPFLFSFSTIDPVLLIRFLAWTALTILLVLIFFIQSLIFRPSSDFTVIYRAIFPIVLGYAVVSGLSLTQTINLAEGIFEWLKLFMSFTFLYVACLSLVHNQAGVLFLTKSVIVTGLILGIIGICQYFQIAFTAIPGNGAVYATMANKNLLASALFLMLPFILFGAFKFSGGWCWLSLVALSGVIYAVAISETRAVWGALLLSTTGTVLLVLMWYQRLKLTQNEKYVYLRRSLLIFVIFLISFSAAILPHFIGNKHFPIFLNNLHPAKFENSVPLRRPIMSLGSLKGRILLWQKSFQMIKAAPILGIGLGQWKIVLPAYKMNQKFRRSGGGWREILFQRPHNDFLWVFSETGVLGLLGYVLFWGVLIFYM